MHHVRIGGCIPLKATDFGSHRKCTYVDSDLKFSLLNIHRCLIVWYKRPDEQGAQHEAEGHHGVE